MLSTVPPREAQDTAKEPVLLRAVALGVKPWKLGFATGFTERPRIRELRGGDCQVRVREIREAKRALGLPPAAPVLSCYEAGREGFWLQRPLVSHGLHNQGVDASSIEVGRRARRAKAERLDVGKLLKLLIRHGGGEPEVWRGVHVPTVEEEDARALHRELRTLTQESTRALNRLTGLLMTQGVRIER